MSLIIRRLIFGKQINRFLNESLRPVNFYLNNNLVRSKYTLSTNYVSSLASNVDHEIILSTTIHPIAQIVRFKSNKRQRRGKNEQQSDNEDDDDEGNEIEDFRDGKKDKSVVQVRIESLRLDSIVKAGLNISKNKVDKLFYANKIRLNGEKVQKKSLQIYDLATIDVIKEVSPDNENFLIVGRIEILSKKFNENSQQVLVTMRRNKNLTIENYSDAYIPMVE